ncbi:FimV family protein [Aliikangiella sp. G2MR2-5]|uniref:FimV family protein n=1 Tax=Aliikangiella sp. G2MR2-5 TaxID=2788943 RepID=UPI0018ABA7A3|nr:FimV family protein [Aliikangiella sp. G2MR2-5]
MFRKFILLIVSMVGIFTGSAMAVGLGEYELKSGLNQPLSAKITVLSAGELSEHEVNASLASLQEFEKVGVDRLFFLNQIRFETTKDANGNLVIQLSTREPIKEPFLNFLVELNWPNGRMIREYTFLLDPPVMDDSASTTIERTQTPSTAQAEPRAPQTGYRSQRTQEEYTPSFTGSNYGPVSANDTLWSIASRTRPSSQVTIHQTLVAIYRANPHAFANGNINNLMKGEVLNIPDESSIAQVPHRAALQDVVMQNRQWRSGGARQIVQNRSTSRQGGDSEGEARLSLTSPSSSGGDGTSGSGFDEQLRETESRLAESEEKSATLAAENEELRTRLADALTKLEKMQESGAINVSDTELAALTQSQKESESSSAETEQASMQSDSNEVMSETSLGQTEDSSTDSSSTEPAVASSTEKSSAQSKESSAKPATPPAKNNKPIFTPAKSQEKSFMDSILDMGMMLWGGIIAVLLLIAFAVFWRMKQRMAEEDFQDDLVASAGAGSMDTTESFELPDVGDDMLVELDMEDESDDIGDADDESFDPLGEADIYIAYGKFEEAENLLKEAIDDNPVRSDLKVKLLECYAETQDKEKFDSVAQEVSTAVDAEEWQDKVTELREKAFTGEAGQEDDFDLPSTEDIFGEDDFDAELDSISSEDDTSPAEDEEEFDIDMDLHDDEDALDSLDSEIEETKGAVTETFDALDEEDFSLDDEDDFKLDEGALDSSSGDVESEQEVSLDDSALGDLDADDDFSLDLDDSDTEESIDLDSDDDISLDLDDDEFNFDEDSDDDFGGDEDLGGDEIATKLDLARAYIDMGDADGAKEILNEVVAEGNDEQQQEAKSLMEKIG